MLQLGSCRGHAHSQPITSLAARSGRYNYISPQHKFLSLRLCTPVSLYLSDILRIYIPSRPLRSTSVYIPLMFPSGPGISKTKRSGQRAFRYVAPTGKRNTSWGLLWYRSEKQSPTRVCFACGCTRPLRECPSWKHQGKGLKTVFFCRASLKIHFFKY